MAVISIFGTGSCLPGSYEYDTAELVGKLIAEKGLNIATGAYGGVMEAALKGAANYNIGRIGVTTLFYNNKQKNPYVNEEIVTENYIARLLKLLEIADAYIIFPGGTGTLLELAAVWSFKERGIIKNKNLVCVGEQWHEVIQTMSFYSERILDHSHLIKHAESAEEAVKMIIEGLKK